MKARSFVWIALIGALPAGCEVGPELQKVRTPDDVEHIDQTVFGPERTVEISNPSAYEREYSTRLRRNASVIGEPAEEITCSDQDRDPITIWDCNTPAGYETNSFFMPQSGVPEVHLISIYETGAPETYLRTGLADVRVTRTGVPLVLVLSSFAPARWTVTAAEGVQIERVILIGILGQTAVVPDGVSVEDHSNENTGGPAVCGYSWPYNEQGCDTNMLVDVASSLAGAPVASFAGCYTASAFSIGTGECVEEPELAPRCTDDCLVMPEGPHSCLTFSGGQLSKVSLETGDVTPIAQLPQGPSGTNGFGYFGDSVVYCDGSFGPLTRVNLRDGTTETANVPCMSAARWRDGILVLGDIASPLTYFPTFADAAANNGTPIAISTYASRIGVHGDTLLTAWHATGDIDRYSLTTLQHLGTTRLEGYYTWVHGVGETNDGLLVLNATWPEGRLAILDAATGRAIKNVDLGTDTQGLVCDAE